MRKIGIITFHSAYNYGSALQATALQMFLEKNGYEVEILDYFDQLDQRQYKLFRTHYYLFLPIIIEDLLAYRNNKKRLESYKEFRKKYMNITTKRFYSNNDLKSIAEDYDVFICGSDQIWNTSCTRGAKKPYYLNFAKDSSALKISYAPSLAHDHVEEKYIEEFKTEIQNIDLISVREETGKKIIKDLTGREAFVALDPTLLLDSIDYEPLINPIVVPKKYVYVYCLEYNKEIFDYAKQFAQSKGLELIYFRKYTMKSFKNSINSFPYGPSEFLYLIKNAEYVITNSFHATVFSILFEKRFTTFTTKRSGSRMTDFLKCLNIDSRIFSHNINMDEPIDYINVKKKLTSLRIDSKDFLLSNLCKNSKESLT